MRQAIMKSCNGNVSHWPDYVPLAFWSEQISIQHSTGYSAYYMVHGTHPTLPMDLEQVTFLVPPPDLPMSDSEMLTYRIRQLQRRPEDLDRVAQAVLDARRYNSKRFLRDNVAIISTLRHEPGTLVLLRNTRIKKELNWKAKPCYLGPLIVVHHNSGGSYMLADLNGAILKARVAQFRVIPYY
ncbi:hypothetical protein CALCODRAFT_423283, partial [Calocera cornea HHB12733]